MHYCLYTSIPVEICTEMQQIQFSNEYRVHNYYIDLVYPISLYGFYCTRCRFDSKNLKYNLDMF